MQREVNRKGCPVTFLAFYGNRPAVLLNNLANASQANAISADADSIPAPLEALKDAVQIT
jgi:hypothetical protein